MYNKCLNSVIWEITDDVRRKRNMYKEKGVFFMQNYLLLSTIDLNISK